jgi:hypothetical protein
MLLDALGVLPDLLTGTISAHDDMHETSVYLTGGRTLTVNPLSGSTPDREQAPAVELVSATGDLLSASYDGHRFQVMVPASGEYRVRVTSAHEQRVFLGNYNVSLDESPFVGMMEVEPNDQSGSGLQLETPAQFGGSLSSPADVDYFRFTAQADQVVAVKLANLPAGNPAVRLYDPDGQLLASGLDGNGLVARTPVAGTYGLSIAADSSHGTVTGEYYGSLVVGSQAVLEDSSGVWLPRAVPLEPMTLHVVPSAFLATPNGQAGGLTGSYVNSWLGWVSAPDDWRQTRTISGTRTDEVLDFHTSNWGSRQETGITGGPSDDDWDLFSVQWDGTITIPRDGTRLYTRSDDSSRMWIDINGDGVFDHSEPELVDNHWGSGQAATTGPASVPLAAGEYRIRIQYEEQYGANVMQLLWDDSSYSAGVASAGPVRAAGTLSTMDDVDLFRVELTAGEIYQFRLVGLTDGVGTHDRTIGLYNEFGQMVVYSNTGMMQTNVAQIGSGPYILMVSARTPLGLGGYSVTASSIGQFPRQRDVPLYYFDFTGTGTFWGYDAGTYDRPDVIPQIMAGFHSTYGIFDIEMALTPPAAGTEYVTLAVGTFPDMNWGGLGGGGQGNRRVSGTGINKVWDQEDWSRVVDVEWAFGVTKHEGGHATAGVPHIRHVRGFMAGGGQLFPVRQAFAEGGGDGLPSRYVYRERDFLDWVTQAGRIGNESEPNGTLDTAYDLTAWLAEMSADGDLRNDRVVVHGRIDDPYDVDIFRLDVAAGGKFALDVDSAEFQYPLDSVLRVLDASGQELARSDSGVDGQTGIASVDPYLICQFPQAGTYYLELIAARGTFGPYRFKVTPERAWNPDGPRVYASWPDGGAEIESTRQLIFWFDSQLDPATLSAENIEIRGASSGPLAGTASFDPLYSTLVWQADAPLPIDDYTVTFRSGPDGIRNPLGTPLDGETQGMLLWPDVSGDEIPGGDFVTRFSVVAGTPPPTQVTSFQFRENFANRDRITLGFSGAIDALSDATAQLELRGTGPDGLFDTADDTSHLADVAYDSIPNTVAPQLLVHTRGRLAAGEYRLEGSIQDAVGRPVPVQQTFTVGLSVLPGEFLSQTPEGPAGLIGSYFNRSLRDEPAPEDWRQTHPIAGTRVDPKLDFVTETWGSRDEVGITGGPSDANWDDFSVQWDGYVTIPESGTRLATRSDDGSRMWIDLNGDGQFDPSELVDNNWGRGQITTTGPLSPPLPAGTHRVRIQYEERDGANDMQLLWQNAREYLQSGQVYRPPNVVALNVQPGSAVSPPVDRLDITFSSPIAPASLRTDTVRLRYSPDPTFFNETDVQVPDADGVIAWDPVHNRATFQPQVPLASGYYLLELDGGSGGILSPLGLALDGEYLDSHVQGNSLASHWQFSPSGDGIPGGDYRAFFQVLAAHRLWHNPVLPGDVDGSGIATPLDVLMIINFINQFGGGVQVPSDAEAGPPYYDVTGDNLVTPQDVLSAINRINARNTGSVIAAEGEGAIAIGIGHDIAILDNALDSTNTVPAVQHPEPADAATRDAVFAARYWSPDQARSTTPTRRGCEKIGTGTFATADFPGFSPFRLGASPIFSQPRRVHPEPMPQAADRLFADIGDEAAFMDLWNGASLGAAG